MKKKREKILHSCYTMGMMLRNRDKLVYKTNGLSLQIPWTWDGNPYTQRSSFILTRILRREIESSWTSTRSPFNLIQWINQHFVEDGTPMLECKKQLGLVQTKCEEKECSRLYAKGPASRVRMTVPKADRISTWLEGGKWGMCSEWSECEGTGGPWHTEPCRPCYDLGLIPRASENKHFILRRDMIRCIL